MCGCGRVCASVHAHTCMWRSEVNLGVILQKSPACFFETEFLSESWKALWRQGVLTSEPQGSAHFCLPSTGITEGTTTFGFFCECSGVNSGSHAYVAG